MSSSLQETLKRLLKPEALSHWTRPGVEALAGALWSHDAMGLRGFGVPLDEYEPEAELAFAYALGCGTTQELWETSTPERGYAIPEKALLLEYLRRSFLELFDESVPLTEDVVDSFHDALRLVLPD
jgi:hypothetical protein